MEESNEKKQPEIAFKDFKGAITVSEFESVLEIVNKEYSNLEKLCDLKETFKNEVTSTLEKMKEQSKEMPPGLLEKLVEGMKRRAKKEVFLPFENEIKRHKHVTDFLNTFRDTEDKLKYLNFELKFDI